MKLFLVEQAAQENFFGTEWFAWNDAGNVQYRNKLPPDLVWPHPARLALVPSAFVYSPVSAVFHCFAGTAFLVPRLLSKRLLTLQMALYSEHCVRHNASHPRAERPLDYCINKGEHITDYIRPPVPVGNGRACQPPCGDDQMLFSFMRNRHPELFASITRVQTREGVPFYSKEVAPGRCYDPCGWSCVVSLLYSNS
jgi:hypothetical protein